MNDFTFNDHIDDRVQIAALFDGGGGQGLERDDGVLGAAITA